VPARARRSGHAGRLEPLAYAVQALIANEFSASRWAVPYEFADPGESTTLGQAALQVAPRPRAPRCPSGAAALAPARPARLVGKERPWLCFHL